jgi:ABC-type glycerol-3-phosphate transport system substrate-binding protein
MNKYVLFVCSFILLTVLTVYLFTSSQQEYQLETDIDLRETIELWSSNPAVLDTVDEFNLAQDEVLIKTRFFHDQQTLLEELYGVASIGQLPEMAEIDAHYGLQPLLQMNAILPLDAHIPADVVADLLPGVKSRFEADGQLWAWPIGASLPVIYYNLSLLRQSGLDSFEHAGTWDALIDTLLFIERNLSYEHSWLIHADLQTPWYLRTLLVQQGILEVEEHHFESITEEQFTEWDRFVNELQLMPHLTHQLAITQFVEREGLFLIAPYHRHSLLRSLIAGRFDLGILPLPAYPASEHQYIAGGKGLVVFQQERTESALSFISYLTEKGTAIQLSLDSHYLPVFYSGFEERAFQRFLRLYPEVGGLKGELERAAPVQSSPTDEQLWHHLRSIQEAIERKLSGGGET